MEINRLMIPESLERPLVRSREGLQSEAAGAGKPDELKKLEDTAKKFEGIFIHQIFKQMKEMTDSAQAEESEEEESDDKSGEQIEDMYCSFMADAVAREGGLGLWKQVYEQLLSQRTDNGPTGQERLDSRI
jgi:Rod binding domain-containing protein